MRSGEQTPRTYGLEAERRYYKRGRKRLLVRITRLMNFFCCLLMVTNAVLRGLTFFGLVSIPTLGSLDISYYLMILYLLGFSVLLATAEYRWPSVLAYCQFLRSRLGKGLYLVLIGLLIFDDRNRYDMLIGIAMVLVGIFNVIVSCMRKDIDQKEWEEQARSGLEFDDPYDSEEEDAGRKI